jgi:hypothetical protein
MRFQKGQPRHPDSGRKIGSTNKKKLKSLAETLEERGLEPIAELLKLLPQLDAKDAVRTWIDVFPYCYAKIKEDNSAVSIADTEENLLELFKDVSTETLLRVVKSDSEVS